VEAVTVPATATADFTLPTTASGADISWTSDDAAIAVTGGDAVVTRPAAGDDDATVTLTATFTAGEASTTRTYSVTVPAQLIDQATDVRTSFSVPTLGENGSTIEWTVTAGDDVATLREGVADDAATVTITRPDADSDVVLTAVATNGAATASRTFTLTVTAKP